MWVLLALFTGWLCAIYYICSQDSKLKAELFIIYRGFLPALLASPLALFFHHTFAWQFYAIVLFQGITIAYMDYRFFQLFHKFGAGNVNAIQPMTICITFVLWLILKPQIIFEYIAEPIRSTAIIVSLAAIIFAAIKYRNQKIGKQCLAEVLPLLFISSSIDISNKLIMNYAENNFLLILTFHRVALTGWIIGFINMFFNIKKIKFSEILDLKNLSQAKFIVILILSMITINLTMYYAPNPAYTTAIIYLSVIWIFLINKFRSFIGRKAVYQSIELKWILLLLISAIVLAVATQK